MSAAVALEIITSLNTLLQLLATQGIHLDDLVDEYYAAEANGEQLSAADIDRLREEAKAALDEFGDHLEDDDDR